MGRDHEFPSPIPAGCSAIQCPVLGFLLLLALVSTSLLKAQEEEQPPLPSLSSAEQAMESKLPEVAIVKLNAFLTSSAALDDALRERAEEDLTRALLESGDAVGALARLEFPSNETERFWKAEAFCSLGRWGDALPLYKEVASDGPAELREAAAIGRAESLDALGRVDEACTHLARLVDHSHSTLASLRLAELDLDNRQVQPARKLLVSTKPSTPVEVRWNQYVRGRVDLLTREYAMALNDFQGLLADSRNLTAPLQAGATAGLAQARGVLNGIEGADGVLEDFISQHPESPYLDQMFRRLEINYASEENPPDSELKHWISQAPPNRAALAEYYEARSLRRQGRNEKAIRGFAGFLQRFPNHRLAFDAWMQMGQLNLDTGHIPAAITAFEGAMRFSGSADQRARAEIATGNAYFVQGEFLLAAETFRDAAPRSADLWIEATYDSALAWLHVGNYNRFLEDYSALSHSYPETDQRRDLLLEAGLLQARSGDPRAATTLGSFVRDFPDNRRVAEAQVALAELDFAKGGIESAGHLLRAAYVSEPSNESREQADYLAIFIADASPKRQDSEVLSRGRKFLDTWPSSPLRAQVRMKLGELYFRAEDYANAQTQFETLAQESPGDPLVDKALILAGQSSIRGMSSGGIDHALALFAQVAKGAGPLRLYARQEQALIEAREGHDQEAMIIYDDILRSNPDTSLRLAALCGKADCMVAAAGALPAPSQQSSSPSPSPAPDPLTPAIALYDQVAADPDTTAQWRDQAIYKKARCLEKQGFPDQALAAYYDLLNSLPAANHSQPDFFWFEKAGYEAAAMLEAKTQWPGAIAILEKVAQAGGPRAVEARNRAEQLRLDHFVWD